MEQKNIWIIGMVAFKDFFIAVAHSILVLILGFKGQDFNKYETLNYLFQKDPENFNNSPTAIKIGRAPFSFLLRFFHIYDRTNLSDSIK